MLADVICYWKMTSFIALDGVTAFLCLKGRTNTRKRMQCSLIIGRVLQCNGRKLEEAEDFKCVFCRFLCVRIEIDQLQCVNC